MTKRRIEVKIEDYKRYVENHNSNELDRFNILTFNGKKKFTDKLFKINEEIFNGIDTNYSHVVNNGDIVITFKSNSMSDYRFDLLKEPNTSIYHLGFSLQSSDVDNYHLLTNKKESLEVFNRLLWILKDISIKLDIRKFCIGSTGDDRKDNIYQYMLKNISGWEKKNTDQYDGGWAIYFEL